MDPSERAAEDDERRRRQARDAVLVDTVRQGDPGAFGRLHDEWRDQLFDLAVRLLRSREEAVAVVCEAFAEAWYRLPRLERPEALGAWLLGLARQAALARDPRAVPGAVTGGDGPAGGGGPDDEDDDEDGLGRAAAAGAVLPASDRLTASVRVADAVTDDRVAALVWAAAHTLTPRDLTVLDLHLRHRLTAADAAGIVGLRPGAAEPLLEQLYDQFDVGLRAAVLVNGGRPRCPELAKRLRRSGLETFDVHTARFVERHARDCRTCSSIQDLAVEPVALFAAIPMVAAESNEAADIVALLEGADVPLYGSRLVAGAAEDGSAGPAPLDPEAIGWPEPEATEWPEPEVTAWNEAEATGWPEPEGSEPGGTAWAEPGGIGWSEPEGTQPEGTEWSEPGPSPTAGEPTGVVALDDAAGVIAFGDGARALVDLDATGAATVPSGLAGDDRPPANMPLDELIAPARRPSRSSGRPARSVAGRAAILVAAAAVVLVVVVAAAALRRSPREEVEAAGPATDRTATTIRPTDTGTAAVPPPAGASDEPSTEPTTEAAPETPAGGNPASTRAAGAVPGPVGPSRGPSPAAVPRGGGNPAPAGNPASTPRPAPAIAQGGPAALPPPAPRVAVTLSIASPIATGWQAGNGPTLSWTVTGAGPGATVAVTGPPGSGVSGDGLSDAIPDVCPVELAGGVCTPVPGHPYGFDVVVRDAAGQILGRDHRDLVVTGPATGSSAASSR
jgi:DNA-directed RNA polymerase specialized sigma24 family protein